MHRTTVTRRIASTPEKIFDAIAHIERSAEVVPDIVNVEFLTEQRTGAGTRFRETRLMGKREATTELEVTEYEPNSRVRFVSDAGGTVWDTVFHLRPTGDGAVELELVLDASPYKLLSKAFHPLIKGMVQRAIEKDMDAVKLFCER